MKQTFILLLILGSFATALAQKGNTAAPVITRYYHFTGTIDKYPVTFHLYRINNKFSGCYYYNSSEEAIDIFGTIDNSRFLNLTHNDAEGTPSEVLSGTFKDSSFSGTWSYKGKLLPFRITQKKDSSGLQFDYIYTSGSKKLPAEEYNRKEISYDAATIWPAPSSTHPASGFIKQVIYESFGEKEGKEEIGKVMIRRKNDFLNPGKKDDEEGLNTYAASAIVKIAYRNPQLLTLSEFLYTDGGGAHGIYGTHYTCIDLVHNRKLAISDVLDTLASQATLQTLLAKKFRAVYHLKNEEKLSEHIFTETIPLSDNFSITSKGIGLNYVPYELGAYGLGEVFLYIPFKELNSFLKPEFKQLIGMTDL